MDAKLPVSPTDTAQYKINGRIRNLMIPYSQLILCTRSNGELFCEQSLPMRFSQGDIIYIAPEMLHGYISDGAELILVSVGGTYAEYMFEYFELGYCRVINNCSNLSTHFLSIHNYCSGNALDEASASAVLYELLTECGIKALQQNEVCSIEDFMFRSFIQHLTENYSKEDFSFEPLLKKLGIDRKTLDSAVHSRCEMDCDEYYMYFRMELLRCLLYLRPHLDISRCAVTNNIKDKNTFDREFLKRYGVTAEEYVK